MLLWFLRHQYFYFFRFPRYYGGVNSYLGGSVDKFRRAILIGTAIPLAAYLVWQLATHGVLSQRNLCAFYKLTQR